jgi:chemotaxis protein CheC
MGLKDIGQLDETRLDVLKEIGNIGAGNAATSLARMLNRKIGMKTPDVRVLEISEAYRAMGGPETPVAAVLAELRGDIGGIMMFVIRQDFTRSLLETLLGKKKSGRGELDEMERSALAEIGNIMIGAYAASIAALSGLTIQTSVPALASDMVGAVLVAPAVEMSSVSSRIILIEDAFLSAGRSVSANMILMPDIRSLNRLMNSLGVA